VRVVLDTNVVVSALIFPTGALARIRDLWRAGRILALTDRACTAELVRVLAYRKFRLDASDIAALLEDYLPFTETVSPRPVRVPRCPDPDDRKFLLLATRGAADVLVTGDRALYDLAGRVRFAIEPPAALLARFVAR
jgi:putative PIN family toxin of toxin-antitoxin system